MCKKLIICNSLRFPDKFITWLSLPTSLFWSAETLEWSSLGFNRAGEMTQLLMGPGDHFLKVTSDLHLCIISSHRHPCTCTH